ncbi:MAG: hypothetical protein M4D80_07700 [Myxococcota bacterium]|nr:hypothetical protein [Deltaproteobacteria bacterium]MDQ3335029.1 hypothetical protein [Myxococcota bacterium]
MCRGCRFVNEGHDKFCGGCGSGLVEHTLETKPVGAPKLSITFAPPPEADAAGSEINELFAPVAVTADDSLPSANITQADLDRLFGVGS